MTWTGESLVKAGGWLTKRLKGLLPLISVCLIYTAISIVRVGAAAALISIPVVPIVAVRSWSAQA